LPMALATAVVEVWNSACMGWALCPLLNFGAIELLQAHGSPAQKELYLRKLVSGEWTGTMNLTEPQAGSDLGALRSRAVPARDDRWGEHYRISGHARVAEHLAYVEQHGLHGVVSLVATEGKTYNQDPRGGFWASAIQHDPVFASDYIRHDPSQYVRVVTATRDSLFDRDTSPGAEPEDLFGVDIPALVVPGRDKSHATSAARYLEECLPKSQYWDVAPDDQTEETVPPRILEFLVRGGTA